MEYHQHLGFTYETEVNQLKNAGYLGLCNTKVHVNTSRVCVRAVSF